MLSNRTIILTGACGGLGRVLALAIAKAGANLILSDLDTEQGQALAREIGMDFIRADLEDPKSIADFGNAVAQKTNNVVHGLVNNGAIATGVGGIPFEDIPVDSWDKVMRVNVRGTWLMCRAVLPMLQQSASGRIVNIASDTALWGAPNLMSYVSSKGAIISMSRAMARELGQYNMGVFAVAPGIMDTESTAYVPKHRHKLYEQGRAVHGRQHPQDIAQTIVFLLGRQSLCLTGQTLPVNAGFIFN